LPAVSIGWGIWEDTGLMKGGAGALKLAELTRQGIHAIPPARGAALFQFLCQSEEPGIAVLPIDWAMFKQARVARNYPIFADNMVAAVDETRTQGQTPTRSPSGGDSLNLTVRKAVGAVLKISPSRLDPRKPLGAMGLTSLMAIELRNLLEAALSRPLSATLAWNHPTLEALVDFLGADPTKAPKVPILDNGPSSDANSPELAAMSDLSDEDAVAALRNLSVTE
jgi:acyl carrier protein